LRHGQEVSQGVCSGLMPPHQRPPIYWRLRRWKEYARFPLRASAQKRRGTIAMGDEGSGPKIDRIAGPG